MNEHLNMLSAKIERFSPVVNTGRAYNDGSRHHASANKEYFTSASSAQWQCGVGNFEIGRWVRFDTVSSQDLINKGAEYSLDVLTNKFRFGVYTGSAWTYVTANTFGALSAATWYFVRAWIDRTAGTINISVNNGTADSVAATAPTAGSAGVVVGAGTAGYFNGRWDSQYVTHRLSTPAEALISYNGGNGQTGLLMSTTNPTRFADIDIWHDGNEAEGTAYDIIGTNHLTAAADPIIAPPVYGSELVQNPGFETAGAGGSDVFANWVESAGDGAIADETTIVHSGSHAAKLTSGVNKNTSVYQDYPVTAGASYYYSFWGRGDGNNAGRYNIYNVQGGSNIVATASINNSTIAYQLFTGQFTAPTGCTTARILLYSPAVTGGIAYFDDVSVKQIITPSINNGGFEDWTTPTNAAVWTENVAGSSTVNQETAAPYAGSSAARLDVDSSGSNVNISQPLLVVGKKYALSLYAKAAANGQRVGIDGFTVGQSFLLTNEYANYTLNDTATTTSISLKRWAASNTIYIDQVTLTSLGPTAEAGITAGLALNTNGVSKVMNDGWNAGSFAQITLAKRPLYSTAYFGGCVLFDGVDDYLSNSADTQGTGDITTLAVVRPTGWNGGVAPILNNGKYHLYLANGYVRVSSDGVDVATSATALSLNTSYVVGATRKSSGRVTVFINGVVDGTVDQVSGTPTAGTPTVIGNRTAFDKSFPGYIGDIVTINRILNNGDMSKLSRRMSLEAGGVY